MYLRDRGDVVQIREQLLGSLDHRTTDGRQEHATPVALEQHHAERRLQVRDLAAQRRLGDMTFTRGGAEVQVLRRGDEALELPNGRARTMLERHARSRRRVSR